jgi:hypothetical protein
LTSSTLFPSNIPAKAKNPPKTIGAAMNWSIEARVMAVVALLPRLTRLRIGNQRPPTRGAKLRDAALVRCQ